MIAFADSSSRVRTIDALQRVRDAVSTAAAMRSIDHDAIVAALIDAGVFEAAVADALCPSRDAALPPLRTLRRASEALGLALVRSWRVAGDLHQPLHHAASALARLDTAPLPSEVELRTPEGYAYYALYPEAYVDATLEWASTRPLSRIVCLGLRGIGTSLSAAAHGALVDCGIEAMTWTVRPHGHPFDRRVDLDLSLLHEWDAARATFLLVDEGPGLSGSSIAGAARFLTDRGVPADRVVLLAAWHPDPAQLNSPAARDVWTRHEVITGHFDRVRRRVVPCEDGGAWIDVSGGRWRDRLLNGTAWPAAHPQHERVKFLSEAHLVRFAGLGSYGSAALQRAERLASAGWSPAPRGLHRGFLALEFESGAPMSRGDVDETFVTRAADYVAWLRRHERTDAAAPTETLADMLLVNVREALGEPHLATARRLAEQARIFDEPAVALDGRVLMHEWIRTAHGVVKTDALDHHRDHFVPGVADIAWDVAGVLAEADFHAAAREAFLDRYALTSADRTIRARLPFYQAAYLAFRAGYCTIAERSVTDSAERQRFARARTRYEQDLRDALSSSASAE